MNNFSMKFRSRSGTKRKTSLRTAFYFMTFIDDLEICSRSSALSFTVQMRQFYGPVSYSILSSRSNFSFFFCNDRNPRFIPITKPSRVGDKGSVAGFPSFADCGVAYILVLVTS